MAEFQKFFLAPAPVVGIMALLIANGRDRFFSVVMTGIDFGIVRKPCYFIKQTMVKCLRASPLDYFPKIQYKDKIGQVA